MRVTLRACGGRPGNEATSRVYECYQTLSSLSGSGQRDYAGTRLCWHETKGMAGQPCPPCIVDPTKLKYLAVTVMTAANTVLAKSVRFLEHVSPGCCAGIASSVPVSWSA